MLSGSFAALRCARAASLFFLAAAGACANPSGGATASRSADAGGEIEAFNRSMIDATRRMDDRALVALWEDDGVTLMPGEHPTAGRKAIGDAIARLRAENPDVRMASFEMQCGGVEVTGDTASEFCEEHQVVELGGGKPPFDGRGKALFVLHRGSDAVWRLRREMWNQGAGP